MGKTINLANTVDVDDVEVCQTGIEYSLASGPKTFTTDDLADAVASQEDPAIKAPRLKLGHIADIGALSDGQPAIGTVTDMRLDQGDHLVLGKYKDIPEWLATILPSAYPARSIEGASEVVTNTGHNWRLIITDLALLGVVWPGVSTLEDIQALYSVAGPDNLKVLTTKEEVAKLSVAASRIVTGQVDVDSVARAYREQKSPDQFWWWIRSMYMDPNELIVEDEDTGDLYRVPYELKGDDEITFKDPILVKIKYVDKPKPKEDKQAASLAAAAAAGAYESVNPQAKSLAHFATREESMLGNPIMADIDPVALRQSLGLEGNATDDEVRTALQTAGLLTAPSGSGPAHHEEPVSETAPGSEQPGTTANPEPGQRDDTAPGGPNDPNEAQPTQPPPGQPGQPPPATPPQQAAGGLVQLDRETYNRLVSGAQAGEQAYARQQRGDRDAVITAAIEQGRIPPSRRTHWEQAWERDNEGTRTLLTAATDQGGLAPGLIPVTERGGESPLENTTVEAYPSDWLPELNRGGQT